MSKSKTTQKQFRDTLQMLYNASKIKIAMFQ